ncbi:hypothetical protein BH11ACT2_BH11ACT2_11670 [soil metagenome]
MIRLRRRSTIALTTTVAVAAGLLVGAVPANAATSHHSTFHFKYQIIDGFEKRTLIRGSGSGGDTLTNAYRWASWGTTHSPKPTVTLQRKVHAKWITQKSVKVTYGGHYTVSAKLPAFRVSAGVAKQKVLYRFASVKSARKHITNSDHSRAYGITYENQAMYSGFQAQMYGYLQQYCASVALHIDASVGQRDHAGEFAWSRGVAIDPSIANYPVESLQGVALHECAHAHQFYNFGASYAGTVKAQKASAAIFVNDPNPDSAAPPSPVVGGFDAFEHAADCASHSVQPAGYLGYGGYCNPGELDAGNRLLTTGSRY